MTGYIDGRRSEGKRLGWIPLALHEQVTTQLLPGQSVSDWVVEAIQEKLARDEQAIEGEFVVMWMDRDKSARDERAR